LSKSEVLTNSIRVRVESRFLAERSNPHQRTWTFAYHVRIANEGDEPVQLISRHWEITDGNGRVEQVRGPGVVGEQPTIPPGGEHEYGSFCSLSTPFGIMHGTYQMVTDGGKEFDANIAPFQLGEPETVH